MAQRRSGSTAQRLNGSTARQDIQILIPLRLCAVAPLRRS